MKEESIVVAKIIDSQGSTPRKTGAWLLVEKSGACHGTVGGGLIEAEVIKAAKKALETQISETLTFRLDRKAHEGLDMRCGGNVEVSIEYIEGTDAKSYLREFKPNCKAFIFGAGHIGKALEPVLLHIGFDTVVIDDRDEFANKERFPQSEVKVIKNFESAFDGIETDDNSYIVIVTRVHLGDYDVLKQSLKVPNAYIGMIGSRKKVGETLKILNEKDGFSQEKLDKIYSPIGLSIHSETPEEIAISIAAEMITVRAGHGK